MTTATRAEMLNEIDSLRTDVQYYTALADERLTDLNKAVLRREQLEGELTEAEEAVNSLQHALTGRIKEVRELKAVAQVVVKFNATTDEYEVWYVNDLYIDNDDRTYYTDSEDDAIATAKQMVEELPHAHE